MFDNGNFRRKRKRRSDLSASGVASGVSTLGTLKTQEGIPIALDPGKPCSDSPSSVLEPTASLRDTAKSSSPPVVAPPTPSCLSTFFSGMNSLSSGPRLPELQHRSHPAGPIRGGSFNQDPPLTEQLQRVSGPAGTYYSHFHPSNGGQSGQYNHLYNFTVNSLIYAREGTEV